MADIKSETITGGRPGSGAHRVVALCGPYLSGKTSLLESILYATGAIGRRGSTRAGTSIGAGADGPSWLACGNAAASSSAE